MLRTDDPTRSGEDLQRPPQLPNILAKINSVEEVEQFVDSVVAPYSKNEYFEMTMHGL